MFLQPALLWALPLIALPIVIHLINRNRHRTVPWAAMMFLIEAHRMQKGITKLRYWLIMAARMAAIAALIFALSRPLATGWFGSWGSGKPDTTLVLLDRSASMETQDLQTGNSKRSTALAKLSDLLDKRGFGEQLVLIDSATYEPQTLETPQALLQLPNAAGTATTSDVPKLFESALAYLKANESGRADIWICSDLHESDWHVESGRWAAIRDAFSSMTGVHHFLLSYPESPKHNLSIRIENVARRQTEDTAELVLDIVVQRTHTPDENDSSTKETTRVPIEFDVDGVQSVVEMEIDQGGGSLRGHRIPIDREVKSGWGKATVPTDSNQQDNLFFFVFSEPVKQQAVIVTDDARLGETFELSLSIPSQLGLPCTARIVTSRQTAEIDWANTALIVWQRDLPTGLLAEQVQQFVDSGRVLLHLPSENANWKQLREEQQAVSWWRNDAGLLANVGNGDALPLNELRVFQHYDWRFDENDKTTGARLKWRPDTAIAKLGEDLPLLSHAATKQGDVYFFHTLPTAQFSSLERDAISFYVLLHRALARGSESLSDSLYADAGREVFSAQDRWQRIASIDASAISSPGLQAGVFQKGNDKLAINRSNNEDDWRVANSAAIDQLFNGLTYERITDTVENTTSLASEIWRWFLIAMLLALICEAVLCLPQRNVSDTSAKPFSRIAA